MQLTVAIIGAPHGLKGEVRLDVRTDSPQRRLAVGTMLETDPPEVGPLTIERTREYKGATYVLFSECRDRNGAEALRGVALIVETDEEEAVEEDAWYSHELVGLEVLDPDGYTLGEVIALDPMPAQDLLVVREPDGIVTRVPFVKEIVTEVDLADGCVVVDAPAGLFSEEEMIVADDSDSSDDDGANGSPDA
ncbi:ribosome maturation factor RimM [Actinomycetaceae bacterium L2_0104]